MNSRRYLNTILTVIAVLLSLQLWTSWNSGELSTATPAMAQPEEPGGLPNAGAQRKQQIDLLKKIVTQNDALVALLRSGQVRVQVEATAGK
jgi:hypothetical protein